MSAWLVPLATLEPRPAPADPAPLLDPDWIQVQNGKAVLVRADSKPEAIELAVAVKKVAERTGKSAAEISRSEAEDCRLLMSEGVQLISVTARAEEDGRHLARPALVFEKLPPDGAARRGPLLSPSPPRRNGRLLASVQRYNRRDNEPFSKLTLRIPTAMLADIGQRSYGSENAVLLALIQHAVADLTERQLFIDDDATP